MPYLPGYTSRLIVAGSRRFEDYQLVCDVMNDWVGTHGLPGNILCGTARGADEMGRQWAIANDIPLDFYPADWSKGQRAGFDRNTLIAPRYASVSLLGWV